MIFGRIPFFIPWFFPAAIWKQKEKEKVMYLTFDDGPTPEITEWVLHQLDLHQAKGTFFCIGDNIKKYPDVYEQLERSGHAVGNHTEHHIKGWGTDLVTYLNDVAQCQKHMHTNLFRPPYGRIKWSQLKALQKDYKVIMWSILSGDYVKKRSGMQCATAVLNNAKAGDIVVFHDSEKAFPRLKVALPLVLEHFSKLGYEFRSL